ncbi:MAG: trypsin-like peptidase domain-containing protein [Gemmatimonadales bacterium]|nr:trypsin-like peptidase domain-containing protein [Gemmatimonadales bacterium]MDZ4388854.1 trypsin-like peptidase domain-containing protein [Gemmatimonadales bacterium]
MTTHARNWLKFGSLVGLAFVLGLFFAGLLNLPKASLAQDRDRGGRGTGTPILPVSAPKIPAARPLAELSEAYAAVAQAVRPAVVFIRSERPVTTRSRRGGRLPEGITIPPGMDPFFQIPPDHPESGIEASSGSGFVVSADGYILTNHHVIEGATRVRAQLLDGRVFDARVIGSDANTDVAVLKVDATDLTPSALGSSDDVRVGEWVLAIGNPLGEDLTFSVTQGIVSAKGRPMRSPNRRDTEITDYIQTDAAINRGNSGGPLLNVRGEVIGIVSAIASETGFFAGYAFAVPIDLARNVMNQIIENGRVERTALGVFVESASSEDAQYLGLDAIAGVRVRSFSSDDSPAKRAGLEPGDVIVAVDGVPVQYVAQLQQLVGFRRAGEEVRLEVARKSGREELTARLTTIPSSEPEVAQPSTDQPESEAEKAPAPTNRLGIIVEPLSAALIQRTELPAGTRGLLVRSVPSTSPASGKLLGSDKSSNFDVITAVEGKAVRTEAELRAALKDGKNGVVSVTVLRGALTPQVLEEPVRVRLLPE